MRRKSSRLWSLLNTCWCIRHSSHQSPKAESKLHCPKEQHKYLCSPSLGRTVFTKTLHNCCTLLSQLHGIKERPSLPPRVELFAGDNEWWCGQIYMFPDSMLFLNFIGDDYSIVGNGSPVIHSINLMPGQIGPQTICPYHNQGLFTE